MRDQYKTKLPDTAGVDYVQKPYSIEAIFVF